VTALTRLWPFVVLAVLGAAWGATQPLAKVAVSEGYRPVGILFWQALIGALVLGAVTWARGRRLPLTRRHVRLYLIIALIGTVVPGIASYSAAVHLPSGVLSILLSSVPMLAFPIALFLGLERFRAIRLTGLSLGLMGVALLVLPETGLPPGVPALWVGIALISSFCYACEGNYVAFWGTEGLGPVEVLAGASALAAVLTLPMALAAGQFIDPRGPWEAPDRAILASALLHAFAYSGYVWLVRQAGSVFAVQVSYPVTLFGVVWAILFLGEGYSAWFWTAAAVLMAGVVLVQPRPRGLARASALGQTTGV
jgi:drug/metabolite transporter (DMT)-like permease